MRIGKLGPGARIALAAMAAGALAILLGCAASPASPRKPYATLPVEPGPTGGGAFRILDDWKWLRTVPAPEAGPPVQPALAGGMLGLFPASAFRLVPGTCADCALTPAAALWWFQDEVVAVPSAKVPPDRVTGAAPRAARPFAPGLPPLPPLAWIGAPQQVRDAQLSADGGTLRAAGRALGFALPPPLATNTAYVDASTLRFFAQRPLRVRGAVHPLDAGLFVGRTLWPQDARIDAAALRHRPLKARELLGTLVEAQRGAAEAFAARLLFEADRGGAPRDWAGRPVLAFMLSGAQADDDGARAGHLAVATGVVGEDGQWADWLVNNFYPARQLSEKGIVPGPVPADNYLFDVNSGQLYYRPGYMLVAILRQPRVATQVQAALQGALLDFHCGRFGFERESHNSTAMTIDPLRRLGWRIPPTGPTSTLAALLGAPIGALVGGSLETGKEVWHALSTERTRLLPRVAFEVAGHDLLYLLRAGAGAPGGLSAFERMLVQDVQAVLFVQLPQVPSSRRTGTYPVQSMLTYGVGVFTQPGKFETAPDAGTRELPDALARSCRAGVAQGTQAAHEAQAAQGSPVTGPR